MSGKQMKRMRRIALGLATTLTESGKKIDSRAVYSQEHKHTPSGRLKEMIEQTEASAEDINKALSYQLTFARTTRNRPDTLRGITQTIKKGIKSGKVPKMPPANTELLHAHETDIA